MTMFLEYFIFKYSTALFVLMSGVKSLNKKTNFEGILLIAPSSLICF